MREGLLLSVLTLVRREVIRFYRQPTRVVGAFLTPIVFWLILGFGLNRSFNLSSGGTTQGYLEYFFPGTMLMILLFTAVYSTISIIEDRNEGFLQAVLVAPVSRQAVVLGKTIGATVLAVSQGVLFLLLAPFAGIQISFGEFVMVLIWSTVVSFSMTFIGFLLAWRLNSTQGFHGIMNVLLFPMWLLSGAAFPSYNSTDALYWIMRLNPLAYGLDLIRSAMYAETRNTVSFSTPLQSATIVVLFSLTLYVACVRMASSQRKSRERKRPAHA